MEQDQARIPKYIPIRDAIAHDIESGVLEAHAKLPSERVLSNNSKPLAWLHVKLYWLWKLMA